MIISASNRLVAVVIVFIIVVTLRAQGVSSDLLAVPLVRLGLGFLFFRAGWGLALRVLPAWGPLIRLKRIYNF